MDIELSTVKFTCIIGLVKDFVVSFSAKVIQHTLKEL